MPVSQKARWPTTFPNWRVSTRMDSGCPYRRRMGSSTNQVTQQPNSPFSRSRNHSPTPSRSTRSAPTPSTRRIGVEPSGEAFNEISVDRSTKIPKNPMINAGAIAAVSLIPASSPDERFGLIQEFYSGFAGRRLELDADVYASEKATGSRNRAIGYMLRELRRARRRSRRGPGRLLPAVLAQCHRRPTWPEWVRRWPAAGSTRRPGAG